MDKCNICLIESVIANYKVCRNCLTTKYKVCPDCGILDCNTTMCRHCGYYFEQFCKICGKKLQYPNICNCDPNRKCKVCKNNIAIEASDFCDSCNISFS